VRVTHHQQNQHHQHHHHHQHHQHHQHHHHHHQHHHHHLIIIIIISSINIISIISSIRMIAADDEQAQQQQHQQMLLQQVVQQINNMNERIDGMNNNIEKQMININQRLDGLTQQNLQLLQMMAAFQNWTIVEKNAMYKSINKQLGVDEPLHVLINEDGIRAPGFPATKTISNELTVQQLNTLLAFFALDLDGSREEKLTRFGDFIGVTMKAYLGHVRSIFLISFLKIILYFLFTLLLLLLNYYHF